MFAILERFFNTDRSTGRRNRKTSSRDFRRAALFESLEDRRLLAAMRVASYNVLHGPDNASEDAYFRTILEAIGNETKASITQPVDLLVLQETNNTSINRIESILDSLYTDNYSFVLSPSYSGLSYGFVYNTATLQLLGTQNVSGSFTRPPLRGHFQPLDATANDADFYIYSTHLKADSGGGDSSTRALEASQLRANADALGEGENVLIVGDFNMKNSFEGAYTNLTASGAGQVLDPINSPGNWTNNNAFKSIHTQDPRSGFGGMDDRFDLQFASGELFVSGGLDYIPGTYRAFGNNGTHSLNGGLTGTGAAANVLDALRNASDHIPVVVDYEFQTVPVGVTISESNGSTIVAENSYFDSYSVALNTTPADDVTVTVTPTAEIDLGQGPGVATQMVFTPQTAFLPQTVMVKAVDDLVSTGNLARGITHSFNSSDANYNTLSNKNVDVIIVDNESPTILINEVDAATTNNREFIELFDGGIGNTPLTGKTLVLIDGATDSVYSTLDLDGYTTDANGFFVMGDAGVPNIHLTFASGLLSDGADAVALYDANVSQFPIGASVTTANLVDAVVYDTDDADDAGLLSLLLPGSPQINENQNGAQNTQSISRIPDGGLARKTQSFVATTPTPNAYNLPRPIGLSILNSDALEVAETGATDSYSIALTSVPTDDVLVTMDPSDDLDLGSGPGAPIQLTFAGGSAMSPQIITVAAFDDLFAEGIHAGLVEHTISTSDPSYASLSIDDISVTVLDDEPLPPPSIVISEIMYNPAGSEGAFSTEWVELVNAGTATQDISGWRLSDEDGDWGVIPSSTLLQPGQTAILFDGVDTPITTPAGFRSTWNIPASALVIPVEWSDLDNDPSPINELLQLKNQFGFLEDEVNFDDEGSWPSDDPDGASLFLTDIRADNNVGTNWARSVFGSDDAVQANGFPFSSSDVGSPGNAPAVVVANLIVTESGGSTDVSEGGMGDNFTIAFDTEPSDDVVVTLTPDSQLDLGSGPGVSVQQTFSSINALTGISIAVNANDDGVAESTHGGIVTVSTTSNDIGFNNLVVDDIIVNITDNDIAGISIVQSGGSTDVTEGGTVDHFTVGLDTIPSSVVTVTITPNSQLDLGNGVGVAVERVFDGLNALTPTEVTVLAYDDSLSEGFHSGQIAFSITTADPFYQDVQLANVYANILDNDSEAILSIPDVVITEGTTSVDVVVYADGGQQVTSFVTFVQAGDGGPVFGGTDSWMVTGIDSSSGVFGLSSAFDPYIFFGDPLTTPSSTAVDPSWSLFETATNYVTLDGSELFRFTVDTSGLNAGQSISASLDTEMITGQPPTFGLFGGGSTSATGDFDVNISVVAPSSAIVSRHIFYDKSFFDGNGANNDGPNDDAAIDTGKSALLQGQTATRDNYTAYNRGINGIMVDIDNPAGTLTVNDFEFRVGNSNTPSTWALATAPTSVTHIVGGGEGGSDRVVIKWADNAIEKEWLQVTVLNNANTGLAAADTHYWGNAVGDSLNDTGSAFVNALDADTIRANPRNFLNAALVDDVYDINKDRFVNSLDSDIARANPTNFISALKMISPQAVDHLVNESLADVLFGLDEERDKFGRIENLSLEAMTYVR
ncbi:Endonuclease/Exonuclease/phosphatase family protein [Novipirellula aureliae]|uniref:Endonuclease/Exonuclease/phosphatase family protein n=1 Tax=Novipirellula aureliae TaxID=2527966 RepID=A0A5C6DZR7_9BACT|nr:lamin tail domain-containing protein [Novipirellula aureliae]TWU41277.1 Endonuclease/Exonuclease/phosphatase family protein [Novipirellula aureliae]